MRKVSVQGIIFCYLLFVDFPFFVLNNLVVFLFVLLGAFFIVSWLFNAKSVSNKLNTMI